MTAKRAASFYREYNQSMLADLAIRRGEKFGHYLQLMAQQPVRLALRAVFLSSGAFVEGRAVYRWWPMAGSRFSAGCA